MNTQPDDDIQKDRQRIYERNRDDLLKRQLSNAENFDKAILTYSSTGLAISLTFLKDYGQHTALVGHWLLYMSWAAFVAAIVLTIVSYMVSQKAISEQLEIAENHLRTGEYNHSALGRYIDLVNLFAGLCFIGAVILTTVFISLNVERGSNMANTKNELQNAAGLPRLQGFAMDGAPLPRMQAMPATTVQSSTATPPQSASPSVASAPVRPAPLRTEPNN